jgi:hypothetical protein
VEHVREDVLADETTTRLQRVIACIATTAKAVDAWRNQYWEDLLGLAGLVMLWHGIASFSVGAAWIVVGSLVFAVAAISVIAPMKYRYRTKGDGQ